jgi:L-lactate dehydrogenase (cytochrome)
MIISAASDYRAAAQRILPPFLFHYIDGGAYAEHTLRRNVEDLSDVALRQRILRNMSDLSLETTCSTRSWRCRRRWRRSGCAGCTPAAAKCRPPARRTTKAFRSPSLPFPSARLKRSPRPSSARCGSSCTSCATAALCAMRWSAPRPRLLDAGLYRRYADPGARYRDAHSGMSGPNAALRRYWQAVTHPQWAWDVGLNGRPHDLGNISAYLGQPTGLEDYIGWLANNFDPSISWKDLEWIRDFWDGPMVIKGILDPEDARDAVRFGADGIVVSNHGGRQLDGVLSSAAPCRQLPTR